MNCFLNVLVTTGSAYDWFTFLWWIVVFIIVLLLVKLLPKYIKSKEKRLFTIRVFATVGLVSHLLLYYITYFQSAGFNPSTAADAMFAIAPCNAVTWLLFFSFMFKDSKFRDKLFIVGAYGGVIFGLITMFYPDFYSGYATCDFSIGFWKSIVFHSIMVMTGSLFFAFKIVKPKATDGLLMFAALVLGFYLYGYPLTLIAEASGMNIDFLYVRSFPIQDVFSVQFAMVLFLIVVSSIGIIYEQRTLDKEDRTIYKIYLYILNRIEAKSDKENVS